ncbi:MAG TPA: VWA domain-containing protein [Blastocatellia bacterium]|nr:VWA domain-containing protein [Blastocatellia bacterium]
MRTALLGVCFTALIVIVGVSVIAQKQDDRKKTQPTQQQDTIKSDTELVMVPILATDNTDSYVSDLRKEEFSILEDGVKQNTAFFGSIKEPFHVVLVIDTGLSLNPEDLRRVKMALHEFLEKLRGGDRISVISFNDTVKEGCFFSGDHAVLRSAINSMPAGGGTKVYDAMTIALNTLKRANTKRNVIVLLTDGVDWHSESSTFERSIQDLEEFGTLVYAIRYNNRSQIETMLRKQRTPDFDAVFGANGIGSVDPATVSAGTTDSVQTVDQQSRTIPNRLPVPPTGRGRYPDGPVPNGRDIPSTGEPGRQPDMRRAPDPRDYPDKNRPASKEPSAPATAGRPPAIGTSSTLDNAYNAADQYLKQVADTAGGELYRTDKVTELPDIFQRIVSDLRNQYLLGYYPTNAVRDGKFRKLKVQTTRKDVVIRTRPGYRVGTGKP